MRAPRCIPLQEYAAIGGNPRFCELSAKLAFGGDSKVLREKHNCTVQALSGTGSLRVCSIVCSVQL
jgi:aspartate/tyrosine/aromatic aminotransferase